VPPCYASWPGCARASAPPTRRCCSSPATAWTTPPASISSCPTTAIPIAFIDTCYAGNALGALNRSSKRTDRLINDLTAAENGVIVFASSTGREESLEHPDWGNGAFTKALLEGIAGKADFTRAGRVTYAALNLFVSEEVTRLTQGRQRPVFISPRGVPDFAVVRLWVLSAESVMRDRRPSF
jgi:hypothetical protein